MARTSDRLPKTFPVGSKYIVESHGSTLSRYVEFPNGRKISLSQRAASSCSKQKARNLTTAEARSSQRRAG
jgi:hypothetical protein